MTTTSSPSILGRLRALTPQRDTVTFDEALRIAELQAIRLQELLGADVGVQEGDIAGLPRVSVVFEDIAVSGMSHWDGRQWVVTLNRTDGWARQRFTLCHELKHIIDHGHTTTLYRGSPTVPAAEQAERAADYFAGCALVPRRQLKSVWGQGMQRVAELSTHFGVSETAMAVRLAQTGLSLTEDPEPTERCARPVTTSIGRPQRFRIARRAHRVRIF